MSRLQLTLITVMGHYNDPWIRMWAKGSASKSTVQDPGLASADQPHPSASNTGVGAGEQLFAQACAKHQQGNADVALELYQQAVRSDPTLAGAWRNLGALLRQRGQLAEAQHSTEQALALDRNDGSLWGNYGNVLRDQGQLEESCKAFQEGLQRTPGSKGLLQGLAISLGRRGEHQQVVQLLTPVVEQALLQSNAGDNALADLLLELGNAHHALEQNDLALQRWQQGTRCRRRQTTVYGLEHCPSALQPETILRGRNHLQRFRAAFSMQRQPRLCPRGNRQRYRPNRAFDPAVRASVGLEPGLPDLPEHLRPIATRYRAHPPIAPLLRTGART